jgi:murein tripeptide amidase MpaA
MLAGCLAVTGLHAATATASSEIYKDVVSLLPPLIEWSGASEALIAEPGDPWITPAEKTGLLATPSYDETVAWLKKLVAATPQLEMVSIGKSLQGRDFWMVIASSSGDFTSDAMRASGKPILLAQAGIHSGEIDGKDAGLMLLRDMTVANKRKELLEKVNFLFVPIFNVDGHELKSPYNRINQRGPLEMGWRTNARNQNFNRDYAKLDTPGVRAIVDVINQWQPDLYLDLHVTDGADYQYDITFGANGTAGWSPSIGQWIRDIYSPAIDTALSTNGHIPGPLVLTVNNMDMADGYYVWTADPRYSNAYGDARHLPTVLVENHSLKPYRQRVLGTYILLAASMEVLAGKRDTLAAAVTSDKARRPDEVVLGFVASDDQPVKSAFAGIASERYEGVASGSSVVRWKAEPDMSEVAQVHVNKPKGRASRPSAYIIPAQWADVAERVAMHGIPVEKLTTALTLDAEIYHLPGAGIAPAATWTPNPFEGRVRIDPGEPELIEKEVTFPAGSYRVSTDNEFAELVMLLLEPQAPDSFFQWGFFLEIFTRTEYAEAYVMEPLAQKMLAADPALKAEFEAKLAAEPEFAADPQQRIMWFYQKTPFYDQRYLVYPVARIADSK